MVGFAVATAALGASAALATAGAATAEASPGATAAEFPAAAASPWMVAYAVAQVTGRWGACVPERVVGTAEAGVG